MINWDSSHNSLGMMATGSITILTFQMNGQVYGLPVTAVRQLMIDSGLPLRLRDVGVTEAMIPELADNAIIDLNWTTNPRAITRDHMEMLYRETF